MPVELQEPDAGLQCPVCRVALVMSDRQNIEIDYCPKCRGVWLDRGELDEIIERSVPAQQAPPVRESRSERDRDRDRERHDDRGFGKHRRSKHGSGGHGYRRKSWLQELFDD